MSKKKRNAVLLKRKSEYLELFPDDKESKSERMRSLALKEAQDIRKFEINLYWKRTGFFWAFITVIYTALFSVLCKYVDCPCEYKLFIPAISALAGLGFFFSVAWHMVNKGSKFWQDNWEKHVSLLEKSEIGPLYDVYLNPKGNFRNRMCPIKAFDFSVSKVNMWASFTMIILSFAVWIGVVLWMIINENENIVFILIPSGIVLLFTIFLMIFSDGNKDIEISDSEEEKLNMICLQ